MLVLIAVVSLVSATALLRAYAELDEDFLQRWSRAHGLTVTPGNRPMVTWYLRNARVLRTWGALAGFFLPDLAALALGGTTGFQLAWTFVGYLLGALYAELSLVRPRPDGPRSASVASRDLATYLPGELRVTQRALAVAVSVGCLVLALVPVGRMSTWAVPPPGWVYLAAAVAVPTLVAGLEHLQRWLLRRPQPFTNPDLVAADDAIRAQSLQSISGSGIALLFLALAATLFQLALSDVQILRWTMWVPGLFAMGAAAAACHHYGHRPWRVQRRPRGGRAEAAAT